LDLCRSKYIFSVEEQGADPKELKRKRDRERYAQNKDEISKKRREARELKKGSSANLDGKQNPSNTPISISPGTSIHLSIHASANSEQLV
jgi:hypothetical protein